MMLRVSAVMLLAVSLVACGWIGRRDVPYTESQSQPPLQIPEDLDRPVVDEALRIPAPGTGAPDVRGVAPAAAGASTATPGTVGGLIQGDNFVLADTTVNAWRRVGVALARMDSDITVVEQDEAAGRYRLSVSGTQETRGFFRRLIKRDERVNETFDLILTGESAGTRIQAVGGGELARGVLTRLQQRLG